VIAVAFIMALATPPVPGSWNPQLTQSVICASNFRTGVYRYVTPAMKRAVCERDKAAACPGPHWEIDHDGPLELGGTNRSDNLWAQPIDQARIKDRLETKLRGLVCDGAVSLDDARRCILHDWVQCFNEYVGP
jgi:hypothetical protein